MIRCLLLSIAMSGFAGCSERQQETTATRELARIQSRMGEYVDNNWFIYKSNPDKYWREGWFALTLIHLGELQPQRFYGDPKGHYEPIPDGERCIIHIDIAGDGVDDNDRELRDALKGALNNGESVKMVRDPETNRWKNEIEEPTPMTEEDKALAAAEE